MDPVVEFEATLVGRETVLAVGVDVELLSSVVSARQRTDGGTWRLLCPPDVVDELGRAFVLGTAVAEARDAGEIELRTAMGPSSRRRLFVTDETVHAIVGPDDDRTMVTEMDADVVDGVDASATAWFEAGEPATVRMPARSRLIETARTQVGPRFANDLAAVLASAGVGDLDRSRRITDRTLLVALGARHDHLFSDVRTWADEVGVTASQGFTDDRRVLVERGLIESVKVPMGVGHPNYRLRAVDDELIHTPANELPALLRERFADGQGIDDPDGGNGRPSEDVATWKRRG